MPVMSKIERAFCCGALWRGGGRAIAKSVPVERLGRRVLEIGSGSGHIASALKSARPDLEVTATDLDPVMVDAATRRLRGCAGASVVVADATDLPFPDNSFDAVLSCLMLHHVIEWEQTVAEVTRVLAPGGMFIGYDLVRTPVATAVHRLDRSPFRLVSPDELVDEGARAGLTGSVRRSLGGHVMQFELSTLN